MAKKKINSINKGRNFERLVIHKICDSLGLIYDEDLCRRWRGSEGNDIEFLSEKSKNLFPFSIESKDCKNLSIPAWWKKLLEDTEAGLIPALVVHQRGKDKQYIVLDFDDFLAMLKQHYIDAGKI